MKMIDWVDYVPLYRDSSNGFLKDLPKRDCLKQERIRYAISKIPKLAVFGGERK